MAKDANIFVTMCTRCNRRKKSREKSFYMLVQQIKQ